MHNLSICTIFKDEGLYLKDWLDYHLRLGVEHFYLYNNNSSDNYADIIKHFSEEVDVYDWPMYPGQTQAYADCISNKADTKWLAFIDIDEYILPITSNELPTFLTKYDRPNIASLCVFWAWFGAGGKEVYEPIPVPLRFNIRAFGHTPHVKSIVRPDRVYALPQDPHYFSPKAGLVAVDEDYQVVTSANPPEEKTRLIQINHYYTKSREEWQIKHAKGRADLPIKNDFGMFDLVNFNRKNLKDEKILKLFPREIRAQGIQNPANKYEVLEIKPFDLKTPPKILVGTTTHDKGQRLPLLKRNIDNLNLQQYEDWGQIIMIDHSPQDIVAKIVQMVNNSKHPERRAIYWMRNGYPTGSWGKIAHQEILNLAKGNEYYAFHSDDNFMSKNHLSSLLGLFDQIPDLDFAYSHTVRVHGHKKEYLMEGFACGKFDLGAPLLKLDRFQQMIPNLSLIKKIYIWDWLMAEALTKAGAVFTCSGLPTYIWAQFWKCDQEKWEKEQLKPNKKFFPEIAKKYKGFRVW